MSVSEFSEGGIGAVASEAIVANTFVNLTSTANEALRVGAAALGEVPFGIAGQAAAAAEAQVPVHTYGFGFLKVDGSSAAIAAGTKLKPNASGVGIKAAVDGDAYGAIALGPSTAAGDIIRVQIVTGILAVPASTSIVGETATETIAIAQLNGSFTKFESTYAGAAALAIPAASSVRNGTRLLIEKTGSAGAVTITPAAGTVNDGATLATVDADNDWVELTADGDRNDWVISASKIA